MSGKNSEIFIAKIYWRVLCCCCLEPPTNYTKFNFDSKTFGSKFRIAPKQQNENKVKPEKKQAKTKSFAVGKYFGLLFWQEKVKRLLSTRNHHMQDSLFKHGSNPHAERTLVGTEEVSNWTRCFKEGKQKFFTIARTKHTTNEDAGKNEKSTREKHTKNAHEERTRRPHTKTHTKNAQKHF